MSPIVTTPITLRTAFCARYNCPDADFEDTFFWRALYRHAVPLAVFLRWTPPDFFRRDMEFLSWLGRAATMADVRREIHSFRYNNRTSTHWLRTEFRICCIAESC